MPRPRGRGAPPAAAAAALLLLILVLFVTLFLLLLILFGPFSLLLLFSSLPALLRLCLGGHARIGIVRDDCPFLSSALLISVPMATVAIAGDEVLRAVGLRRRRRAAAAAAIVTDIGTYPYTNSAAKVPLEGCARRWTRSRPVVFRRVLCGRCCWRVGKRWGGRRNRAVQKWAEDAWRGLRGRCVGSRRLLATAATVHVLVATLIIAAAKGPSLISATLPTSPNDGGGRVSSLTKI